jgi:hypothetical protein
MLGSERFQFFIVSAKLPLTLTLSQRERGLNRGVWESYADVQYRVELRL